jgi:hypothetical protein
MRKSLLGFQSPYIIKVVSLIFTILLIILLYLPSATSQRVTPAKSEGDFSWFLEMGNLLYDFLWEKTIRKIESEAKQNNQVLIPIFDGSSRVMFAKVDINNEAQLQAVGQINSQYWRNISEEWIQLGRVQKAITCFLYNNYGKKISPFIACGDKYVYVPSIQEREEAMKLARLWDIWSEHAHEVSEMLDSGIDLSSVLWQLGEKYPNVPAFIDATKKRSEIIIKAPPSIADRLDVIVPRPSHRHFMEGRPTLSPSFGTINVPELFKTFIYPTKDEKKYFKESCRDPKPPDPPDKFGRAGIPSLGGIIFDKGNSYTVNHTGRVTRLMSSALQARPNKGSISWEFRQEGKSYRAVTVPLTKKKQESVPQGNLYYDDKEKIIVFTQGNNIIALKCIQKGSNLYIIQVVEGKRIKETSVSDNDISFIVNRVILTDYGLK